MSKEDTFINISNKVTVSSNLVKDRIVQIYTNSATNSNDFMFICQCMILYVKGKWNSKYTVDMDGKKLNEEELKATLNTLKIFKDMNEKTFSSLLGKMGTAFVHLFKTTDLKKKIFSVYSKHNAIFKAIIDNEITKSTDVPDWFIGDFSTLEDGSFATMADWFKKIGDLNKEFSRPYSSYIAGLALKAYRNYTTKSGTKAKLIVQPNDIFTKDQGFRKQLYQVMLTYKLGGMPGTAKPFSDVGLFESDLGKEISVKVLVTAKKVEDDKKTFGSTKERYEYIRTSAESMTV